MLWLSVDENDFNIGLFIGLVSYARLKIYFRYFKLYMLVCRKKEFLVKKYCISRKRKIL